MLWEISKRPTLFSAMPCISSSSVENVIFSIDNSRSCFQSFEVNFQIGHCKKSKKYFIEIKIEIEEA